MPSHFLEQISQQIEAHGTDHFSKFYMYAGLLNIATVRKPGSNFNNIQPQTSPLFFAKKSLKLGEFPNKFATQVNNFQNQFIIPTPGAFNTMQQIVMTYFRKGQLADLIFIIDKMLGHLSTQELKPTDTNNKDIYKDINFELKKSAIYEFINSISKQNHQILSSIDNVMNAAIAGSIALTGLTIILTSTFSLAGLLIGGAMLVGGGLSAYSYALQVQNLGIQLEKSEKNNQDAMNAMLNKMSTYESTISDDNHKSFLMRGIVMPFLYYGITAQEQFSPDENTTKQAENDRKRIDQFVSQHFN